MVTFASNEDVIIAELIIVRSGGDGLNVWVRYGILWKSGVGLGIVWIF